MALELIIAGASAAVAAASAGVGIAGAAGAFDEEHPDVPERSDPAVEEERRRRVVAAQGQKGRSSTILTPLNEEAPDVNRPILLGGSSSISPTNSPVQAAI